MSDEQIVRALRDHGSIPRAARALGIAPQSLRERLSKDPLLTTWRKMRAEDVDLVVTDIHGSVANAVKVLRALMKHGSTQDNIRFAAASKLIETSLKLREQERAQAGEGIQWTKGPGPAPVTQVTHNFNASEAEEPKPDAES